MNHTIRTEDYCSLWISGLILPATMLLHFKLQYLSAHPFFNNLCFGMCFKKKPDRQLKFAGYQQILPAIFSSDFCFAFHCYFDLMLC
jgi:hypothetical protein